jgi:hypothetical protein
MQTQKSRTMSGFFVFLASANESVARCSRLLILAFVRRRLVGFDGGL